MRSLPLMVTLSALALPLGGCNDSGNGAHDPSLIHTVARGDLDITVRERAEVRASQATKVMSQLEGRATLIYLIPEGTVVKAGERVAELDASAIEEARASKAIAVAKVDAMLKQARKNFEIMENDLLADEKTADSRNQIAQLQIEKFLGEKRSQALADAAGMAGTNRELIGKLGDLIEEKAAADATSQVKYSDLVGRVVKLLRTDENLDLAMGEMANQVLVKIDEISLANADLEMAKDTLGHSRRLEKKGFITTNELVRDEINYRRQLSKVTVAWNNLQLLIKYTLPETHITLEREVENAHLALESVRGTNEARRVREDAELNSSEAEFKLARERLDNWNLQVQNAVVRAPGPGLVVYGRYDWDETVYEGMQVREGQEIVVLPDIRTMTALLKVHEAQIDKVAPNQVATVKVDAFPEKTFTGRVDHVSTLPDPNRRNRDLKVFRVKVLLDEENTDGSLRPGMNATVSIDVGTLENVLTIPLPALERRGNDYFVWKVSPQGPIATQVTLGANNLTHVEIIKGLLDGDQIHLVRPAGAQLPDALPPEEGPEAKKGKEVDAAGAMGKTNSAGKSKRMDQGNGSDGTEQPGQPTPGAKTPAPPAAATGGDSNDGSSR